MSADLTICGRKAARAKKDLDTLRNEVTAYMNPAPYRLVEKTELYRHALWGYIDRNPDPEWEIDIGAIAVEARSALDILVGQLVIDSGNDPAKGRAQFPIFRDRNKYFDKRGLRGNSPSFRDTMLKGVDEGHRRVIDQLQPYQRGRGIENDPLVILDTVSNRHKHRNIHAALAAVAGTHFRLIKPNGEVFTVKINVGDRPNRIVDGEIVLALNTTSPTPPDQQMKMKIDKVNVDFFFETDDRLISLDDMERAVIQVANIVQRFSKRLKP